MICKTTPSTQSDKELNTLLNDTMFVSEIRYQCLMSKSNGERRESYWTSSYNFDNRCS